MLLYTKYTFWLRLNLESRVLSSVRHRWARRWTSLLTHSPARRLLARHGCTGCRSIAGKERVDNQLFFQTAPEVYSNTLRSLSMKVYVPRCAKTIWKCSPVSEYEIVDLFATICDWSTVNEFIQEQAQQVLVRYGCMNALAIEPLNIKGTSED